jgi:hypothetical protein
MDDDNTLWPPVEPTTPVSRPLYEHTAHAPNPYEDIPIPPPPPHRRKSYRVPGVLLVTAVLLFSAAALTYWTYTYHVSTTQPTPIVRFVPVTPTQNATATTIALLVAADDATATQESVYATVTANVPVPTQMPSINTAQDIYTQFTDAGIAMGNEGDVAASWWHQCCSYDPANGAQSFIDETSGGTMIIALFGHSQAAQDDVAQMDANSSHPGDFQVGRCLLLYWSASTNLTPYEQVMQQYCV